MNILPHKSWHVRTKANIARVRKDQAKAAEEEAEKQRKIAVADYEARINFLRKKSDPGKPSATVISTENYPTESNHEEVIGKPFTHSEHVELFADYEDKVKKVKPMDEEKRLEQEKYEKQIGYLTYLGQDTNEALGTRNWYDVAPRRGDTIDDASRQIEIGLKTKHLHDPMLRFLKKPLANVSIKASDNSAKESDINESPKKTIPLPLSPPRKRKHSASAKDTNALSDKSSSKTKTKKKYKKHKKHKKDKRKRRHSKDDSETEELKKLKEDSLRRLREKRIQREKDEQIRAKEFLMKKFPSLVSPEEKKIDSIQNNEKARPVTSIKQKYNSQFNPALAKQNYN